MTAAALTASQIKWASSHDWFIRHNADGSITVQERYTINGGELHTVEIVWTGSFADLKAWAGY